MGDEEYENNGDYTERSIGGKKVLHDSKIFTICRVFMFL
jgi:hypothetical protein